MSDPGFLEVLTRRAHELEETAGAAKDEVVSAVKAAPGVIAGVVHKIESAPSALVRSGKAAIDRMLHPPAAPAKPAPAKPATPSPPRPASRPATPQGPHPQAVPRAGREVEIAGEPFLRRPSEQHLVEPTDVEQRQLNDCWLLAALASIARANPASIEHLIRTVGKGLYEVTLYETGHDGKAKEHKVVVDDHFPADDKGRPRGAAPDVRGSMGAELWVLLIEKAMAVRCGGYDGMVALGRGLTARVDSGLDLLQNRGAVDRFLVSKLSEDEVLEKVAAGFAHKRPMTSLSLMTPYAARLGVNNFHHYSVAGVDKHARTISLQNPWGYKHVPHMKIADYVIVFETLEIGPSLA